MRNLVKDSEQDDKDFPTDSPSALALKQSLSKKTGAGAAKLKRKALPTSRITFINLFDFNEPTFKASGDSIIKVKKRKMEAKSPDFNEQPPETAPKDFAKNTEDPPVNLVEDEKVEDEKAEDNKESGLEQQDKLEEEPMPESTEQSNLYSFCEFSRTQIVNNPMEYMGRLYGILDKPEVRHKSEGIQIENQETEPNPLEGLLPLKGLSNFDPSLLNQNRFYVHRALREDNGEGGNTLGDSANPELPPASRGFSE